MSNFDSMHDPFAMVRKMWGGLGFNLPNLPNLVTPTLDVEEIDKKIKDLKAVESWLKMNLSMLQVTIQGLEMQSVTLNAVRAMGQMATGYSGTDGSSPGTTANLATTSGDALRQAAMWPLTLMQQVQEQIQKATSTATAVATPPAGGEETPNKSVK